MGVDIEDSMLYCNYCDKRIGKVNKDWLKHYGFDVRQPKIVPACQDCLQAEMDGKYLVQGYGPMENNNVTVESSTSTRSKKISKEELITTIDMDHIAQLITDKNCKVNKIAEDMNANPVDLRNHLNEHYGDRIMFKRGRNGGVVWSE